MAKEIATRRPQKTVKVIYGEAVVAQLETAMIEEARRIRPGLHRSDEGSDRLDEALEFILSSTRPMTMGAGLSPSSCIFRVEFPVPTLI